MNYYPHDRLNLMLSLLLLYKKAEISVNRNEVLRIYNYLHLAVLCASSFGKRKFLNNGKRILQFKLDELESKRGYRFTDTQYHYLGDIVNSAILIFEKINDRRFYRTLDLAEKSVLKS